MSYGAINATHDDADDTDSDDDTRDTMILILISWVALRDTIMEILILIGWGALRGAGRGGCAGHWGEPSHHGWEYVSGPRRHAPGDLGRLAHRGSR